MLMRKLKVQKQHPKNIKNIRNQKRKSIMPKKPRNIIKNKKKKQILKNLNQ
jgi:hypothetical protein